MRTGVIISDKSVKVAKVKGNRQALLRVSLEPGVIQDGIIVDGAKLKDALSKLALTKEEVVLGLLEKHILGKSLTISDHESNLEAQVEEKLSSYVPAGAESYTDWQVLEKGEDYQKIFVASVPANLLDPYRALFKKLSIVLAGVEPLSFALSRHLPPQKTDTGVVASMIVCLEESEILLTIVNEKGGIELTSVLPQLAGGQKDELLTEISNMQGFYDKKTKGEKVGRIFLTGEGITAELKSEFEAALHIPCDFLRIASRSIGEQQALAFFPAFALCDLPIVFPKNHEHINLLSGETLLLYENERKTSSFTRALRIGVFSLGTLCFLYIAIIGFLLWEQNKANGEIVSLREEVGAGNSSKVRREISEVNKYIAISKKVLQKDPGFVFTTLSFLEEKSGSGITITSYTFDVEGRKVTIAGQSIERDRLIGFGQILETEGKFTNVKIPLTSLEKKGASTFSLSFEVPKQ